MPSFDADNAVQLMEPVTFILCSAKHTVIPLTDEVLREIDEIAETEGLGPLTVLRRQLALMKEGIPSRSRRPTSGPWPRPSSSSWTRTRTLWAAPLPGEGGGVSAHLVRLPGVPAAGADGSESPRLGDLAR